MTKYIIALLALLVPYAVLGEETYHTYTADFIRVVDGDTIELDVHVWPGQINRVHLRLNGINAPEKSGNVSQCEKDAGLRAMQFAQQALQGVSTVTIDDIHADKYFGRMLGKIMVPDKGDLGQLLLQQGLARKYDGGTRAPWCQ